jgi:hypothetical protein
MATPTRRPFTAHLLPHQITVQIEFLSRQISGVYTLLSLGASHPLQQIPACTNHKPISSSSPPAVMSYWRGRFFSAHDFDASTGGTLLVEKDGKKYCAAKNAMSPRSIGMHIANPLLSALDTCEIKRRCYHCYKRLGDTLTIEDKRFQEGKFNQLEPCDNCEMVYFCSTASYLERFSNCKY